MYYSLLETILPTVGFCALAAAWRYAERPRIASHSAAAALGVRSGTPPSAGQLPASASTWFRGCELAEEGQGVRLAHSMLRARFDRDVGLIPPAGRQGAVPARNGHPRPVLRCRAGVAEERRALTLGHNRGPGNDGHRSIPPGNVCAVELVENIAKGPAASRGILRPSAARTFSVEAREQQARQPRSTCASVQPEVGFPSSCQGPSRLSGWRSSTRVAYNLARPGQLPAAMPASEGAQRNAFS